MNKKEFAKGLLKSKISCRGCYYGATPVAGDPTLCFCLYRYTNVSGNFCCRDWKNGTVAVVASTLRGATL